MKQLISLGLLSILLAAATAHADGLRCGNDLVAKGDSIVSVERSCGPPMRQADLVNAHGKRIGTVWYIDAGYGRDNRRVEFRGGRVASIERIR